MANLIERLKAIWHERRQRYEPVKQERRRRKLSVKEVDKQLAEAMSRLEKTVVLSRDDFFNGEKKVANDMQTVVVFGPFSDICKFKNDALKIRLCRNPRHEDAANSALARCSEEKCPLLLEAIKGVAA